MDRIQKHTGTPNSEWLTHALQRKHKHANVDDSPPETFIKFSEEVIGAALDGEPDHWFYFTSVLHPKSDLREYEPQFPHNHPYDGITMVYYAQTPEEGGELIIYENVTEASGEFITFSPEVGSTAFIYDHEVHGVRTVRGDRPRVTLIAAAHLYPPGVRCKCDVEWERVSNP